MSRIVDGATWFKRNFGKQVEEAIDGTPFNLDLITAIAIQETFEIWGRIFDKLPAGDVLALCVGDVIGEPRRTVFPKTKAELLAQPSGDEMFAIAHQALVDMAVHAKEYEKYAANPDRFCHAFGIFQYDIQFFREDPDFFLGRKWTGFGECLSRCIRELQRVCRRAYPGATELDDTQSALVAVGYNLGSVKTTTPPGLRQGFRDDQGIFYGEHVAEFLRAARQAVVTESESSTPD